jgi:oxygen-independent coproporphyrinogen-3 oxidase
MNASEWFETEELTDKDRWNELLLTGLRTSWGIDQEKLFNILPTDKGFKSKIDEFVNSGWMTIKNDRIILLPEGRLKADHIASELFQ